MVVAYPATVSGVRERTLIGYTGSTIALCNEFVCNGKTPTVSVVPTMHSVGSGSNS